MTGLKQFIAHKSFWFSVIHNSMNNTCKQEYSTTFVITLNWNVSTEKEINQPYKRNFKCSSSKLTNHHGLDRANIHETSRSRMTEMPINIHE